jgi:type IV secretory pathway VirB10-like protein
MRDPLSTTIHKPQRASRNKLTLLLLVGAALIALGLAAITAQPRQRTYNETIPVEIVITEPGSPPPQAPPPPDQTAPSAPSAPTPAP